MVSLTAAFTLLAVTVSCLASPPLVRHESRRALPPHWEQSHRASAHDVLPLRIGLAQSNIDRIEELLLDVSHPESQNYGNHWSAAKVAETFHPSPETIDTVREWLTNEGIDPSRIRLSKSGGWIEANVSIAEAEQLLKTEYHVYNHALTDTKHVGCASGYHVPVHVAKHIELITPTVHFDAILNGRGSEPLRKRKLPNAHPGQPGFGPVSPVTVGTIKNIIDELENCDSHITPNCLRALYDFVYIPLATKKNSIGIVEYTPQAYVASDLDKFFTNFSKSQIGERPVFTSIDGGVVQTTELGFGVNGESDLDLQYSMALVGKNQPVTLYQVGDLPQGASFNNLLDALDGSFCSFEGGDDPEQDGIYPDPSPGGYQGKDCGTVKPASVISTSYSYNEADLTPFYTARQCAEYAKLGLMGVTVLYSSGDQGVGGGGDLCLLPNGTQSFNGRIFNPTFPSTCPYITSVGATQVVAGHKVTDPESATYEVIFSGGGFSNRFPIPDYQKSAVQSFLTNYPPSYPADIWNSTGTSRAFPDISANGANYVVAVDGQFELVFGTSASSPVLASILYAINDARLAIGKKPIGFINPTVYSDSFRSAFNDITNGTNPGCGTAGFSAVPGWDPVTGLGTPNFPKLLAKWLVLP
ncbi:subtilisin-like protein [Irpex rosettiformis]|uniref:Subtilisin-like protein n=1 Tax=Irpex rosettiformis TaxID=378272 RepID=A0ACB8UHH4_9APHY|nr:subtilisin-like protein [Irpex rosettiformis]